MEATFGIRCTRPAQGLRLVALAVAATILTLLALVAPAGASAAVTPYLGAMVDHGWIEGNDLPGDTTVTVEVNDGEKGTREVKTATGGRLWAEQWAGGDDGKLLAAGDTITVTWTTDTAQMVIQDVRAQADPANNRVTGTATVPGGAADSLEGCKVSVSVQDYWGQETPAGSGEANVQADGTFVVNVSNDLVRGQKIFLTLTKDPTGGNDGHRTSREPYNGIPTLGAYVDNNAVDGRDFPRDATVTVRVNGGSDGEAEILSDRWGNFNSNWWEVDDGVHRLAVGDSVTALWSGESTTMVVQDLGSAVNVTSETVTGTAFGPAGGLALDGHAVLVQVQDEDWNWPPLEETETVVQADGQFSVNLSGVLDLERGQHVSVTLYHADNGTNSGHRTMRHPYNGLPFLTAIPRDRGVEGEQFPPETSVTVSVSGEDSRGEKTDPSGNFGSWDWVDDDGASLIAPGDTITATYDWPAGVSTTTEMVVADVHGEVDASADRVTGTADCPVGTKYVGHGVELSIEPTRPGEDWYQTETTVTDEGMFTFSVGSDCDIVRGTEVNVQVYDASDGSTSGNSTRAQLYNGIPFLTTTPRDRSVEGEQFPPETSVTVSIVGKGSSEQKTNPNGDFGSWGWGDDDEANLIAPGDTIRATYEWPAGVSTTTEMVVADVHGEVDASADRVTGTADCPVGTKYVGHGVELSIEPARPWDDWYQTETTVTDEGMFTFSVGSDCDIVRGTEVNVRVFDYSDGSTSGNSTRAYLYNGIPSLGVRIEQDDINGEGFRPGIDVTVSVNRDDKGVRRERVDDWENVDFGWWTQGNDDRWLAVGDTVTATFEGTTTQMVVEDVSATADPTTNRVTGTAHSPWGDHLAKRWVRVEAWDRVDGGAYGSVETTVQDDGTFVLDFDLADSPFTLVRGQEVELTLWDAFGRVAGRPRGNRTVRRIYNGLPSLEVNLDRGDVAGDQFPFDTTLTVAVTSTVQSKGTTQTKTYRGDDGSFRIEDWARGVTADRPAAGDTVTASWPGTSTQMVVQDLTATVDPVTDRVAGTAFAPGHIDPLDGHVVRVSVNPWWDGGFSKDAKVQLNGSFVITTTPDYNLERGDWVRVEVYDSPDGSASGNRTVCTPYNGLPLLSAFVNRGRVEGEGFPSETTVSIEASAAGASKGTTETKTDNDGYLNTWQWGSPIEANRLTVGTTLTATWDSTSTTMVIQDLTATADPETDLVTGTARSPIGASLAGNLVWVQVLTSGVDGEELTSGEARVGADGKFSVRLEDDFDLRRGQVVNVTLNSDPNGDWRGPWTKCRAFMLPEPVHGLAATAGDGSATLRWSNPTTDYALTRILRSEADFAVVETQTGWTAVYQGTATSTVDSPLTNSTKYYYTAFTMLTSGHWSRPATVTVTPEDTTPPGAVTAFVATPGDARVQLDWKNPTSDFAATKILRSTGDYANSATETAAQGQTVIYEGGLQTKLDLTASNGTTYKYSAFARDAAGNWSVRVTATAKPEAPVGPAAGDTTPPSPVTAFTATPGNTTVTLTWVNPASDFAATRVLRSTGGSASSPTPTAGQVQIYDGGGTSFPDTGLTNGQTYSYTAFARDAAGNWSARATVSAIPTAPPAPAKTRATLGRPTVPARIKRNGYFYLSGTLRPAHGAATNLSVYLYRKAGRKWLRYKTVVVKLAVRATTYRLRIRLPYRGDWYVYAGHVCARHVPGSSAKRYFKVK